MVLAKAYSVDSVGARSHRLVEQRAEAGNVANIDRHTIAYAIAGDRRRPGLAEGWFTKIGEIDRPEV